MNTSKKNQTKFTKSLDEAVAVGKETVEAAVKAGTDAATENYEKAVAATRDQVEAAVKAGADAAKGYEDIVGFSKDNVDAAVKSATVLTDAAQNINKIWFGYAQSSLEVNMAATKALFACKTFQEVADVQTGLAKKKYDSLACESRKISELTVSAGEKAAAPISSRINLAIEKFNKQAAA